MSRIINSHNISFHLRYTETVKRISELYRDRPQSARETAVYWVEYVIRHRGAPHLRYQGADQNLLQSTSLDVIGFLVGVVYLVYKLAAVIFCKLCCRRKKSSTKKVKFN